MTYEIRQLILDQTYNSVVISDCMGKLDKTVIELKELKVDESIINDLNEAIGHLNSAKENLKGAIECLKIT